ncbi:hypothetical protein BH10PSE16_BH10PSE16_40830 [soil metagenome]
MPAQVLEIEEIIGKSEQGMQTPYKCRAEDGKIYYVKGRQTNRTSLWHEWIGASLGKSFGLAVPPFALVNISQEILAEVVPDWRDLGAGIAFGSQYHPTGAWLEFGTRGLVPHAAQRDVLVFDWWVHNTDRGTHNSNLLWDTAEKQLVVIDHNMAFDADFSAESFLKHHIFAERWQEVSDDLHTQATYAQRLSDTLLASFDSACDNIPLEWHWSNPECDIPARIDINIIRALLSRCETPELWRTV